ncbi:hypothetical protein QJS10_CPA09g01064 [Acorus calamus]|uniref:Ubiquitin-like protease family profile domain-containing protein n=1 Tax=Acorus calamus TaxID=4465 RepID=A0AAV9E5H3_ACOCL|nr:hypothetical protein QJS10_CPA09g01064 [Acorus calamus]
MLVQHRCFPIFYKTVMDGMAVRPCHRRLMKKTPFNILINIPKMQFESELLDVIVNRYNEEGDFFELGGQPIYFTAEDIALIIGLPAFGVTPKLDSSTTESKIKSRFFRNSSMITRGALKSTMSSLVDSNNPRDIKYFVRLWIAFMFSCFLFFIVHYNCLVPLLTMLDDLNSTWNYAWSVAIRNQVMEGVQKQRACIAERNEGQYSKSSMGYVFGCTVVLCAWFYEHTRTNRRRPANNRVSPRLFNWVMKLTRRRGEKDANPFRVKSNEVVIELQVDDGERWLLQGGSMAEIKRRNTPLNFWKKEEEQQLDEPRRQIGGGVVRSIILKRKLGQLHQSQGTRLIKKIKKMKKDMATLKGEMELLRRENEMLMAHRKENEEKALEEEDKNGLEEDLESEMFEDVNELSIVPYSQDPEEVRSPDCNELSIVPFSQDPEEGMLEEVLTEKRRNYQGKRFLDPYLCIGEKWISAWQIRDVLFKTELKDDALDMYFGILEEEPSVKKWFYVCSYAQKTLNNSDPITEDPMSAEAYMSTLSGFFRRCTTKMLKDIDMVLMPVHSAVKECQHWHLLVVDFKVHRFVEYNSMRTVAGFAEMTDIVVQWLKMYFKLIHLISDVENWPIG